MQLSPFAIHTAGVAQGSSPGDGAGSKPVLSQGDCFGKVPMVPHRSAAFPKGVNSSQRNACCMLCCSQSLTNTGEDALPAAEQ